MKKIILSLAGIAFLFFDCTGQEIEWQNTIGGTLSENLFSIQQTNDGDCILGGPSTSDISGDKTENCLGGPDYWIVKLDAEGNIQWQNTIGGSLDDLINCIVQTSDGGYICGGSSISNISGDKTENCLGGPDYWIIKLDGSGNIQWQNTIGGNGYDYLTSISQTSDMGYICAGNSNSDISGDKTENSQGDHDYWIVKIDSSGNLQWQNTIGGNLQDRVFTICNTVDGGYICGGFSYSNISGDKTENNTGTYDWWILKLDTAGNIQWQNTIGGNNGEEVKSIVQTNDGGFICGGYSGSNISGDKTENCIGLIDYWIVKLDTAGNIQWQNTIGGNDEDILYSLFQTTDGGYFCGGISRSSISGDKTENCLGTYDYWALKLDLSGNIQWQNTIGGSAQDYLYSVCPVTDGSYMCGGFSYSNVSGDKTENSLGTYDYWVVTLSSKFNSITGKLFIDVNSNTVQDAGEPSLKNIMIKEINTNRFAFIQNTGIYYLNIPDTGNFSVSPPLVNYYNAVPAYHNAYFTGSSQIDSLNDFAMQPTSIINDLCVTITPIGVFRANQNASYRINYENVGTTILNGTVIFFPDNHVTFVSSNPVATSLTTDSVVWNVGTLAPFQTGNILVTVNVNAGTLAGILINSSARIEPLAGDNYPGCNYAYWEVVTLAPSDPNAILVDRDTVLTTELLSPPYLNYIVYFQNTGNDTAFNVSVLNPIDTFKLDLHSFEFVASSHPVNIDYKIWERNLEFTFDNILLPDSNINEPESHGFIRYRIKPFSTLVAGDSIKNNAAIYFDFNQPVMTNTAFTEIVLPTGKESFGFKVSGLRLYPNPTTGIVLIHLGKLQNADCTLIIYDIFGRKVLKSQIKNPKSEIEADVSDFAKGIYLLEINDGNAFYRTRLVKE